MTHYSFDFIITKCLERFGSFGTQPSIFPFIPKSVKWALLLLLLLNGRNLPLVWHVRIFRYIFYARTYHWFKSRLGFETKAERLHRMTEISPVGNNPFGIQSVYISQAVISSCDYNLHLSNSSYAVALDIARTKFVVKYLPLLYPDGGRFLVGGVCFDFIKEIPLNAKYEVITRIGSWDNKWFYLVSHFATYSRTAPRTRDVANASRGVILGESLPSNAIIHCTAVSRVCFKIKRITIPPLIVLASMGFQMTASKFAQIQSWRIQEAGKEIRDFYAGGWRTAPSGQRWWEDAFADIEPERVRRLAVMGNSTGVPQT